jgi:mono/diheme cytochrome c family protein
MKRLVPILLLTLALLPAGCDDMHDQPSVRAYEAAPRTVPAESVPVGGRELLSQQGPLAVPPPAGPEEVDRGENLYRINCSFCHGLQEGKPGPVGQHLKPPPPSLEKALLQSLQDADIYRFISFGFGRMPPFRDRLNSAERWALVRYLRSRP